MMRYLKNYLAMMRSSTDCDCNSDYIAAYSRSETISTIKHISAKAKKILVDLSFFEEELLGCPNGMGTSWH